MSKNPVNSVAGCPRCGQLLSIEEENLKIEMLTGALEFVLKGFDDPTIEPNDIEKACRKALKAAHPPKETRE